MSSSDLAYCLYYSHRHYVPFILSLTLLLQVFLSTVKLAPFADITRLLIWSWERSDTSGNVDCERQVSRILYATDICVR